MNRRRPNRSISKLSDWRRSSANSSRLSEVSPELDRKAVDQLLLDKIPGCHRFYCTVALPEIIFEHADVGFIPEDPVNMVTRKTPSLSGSKPIVVKELNRW